MSKVDKLIFTDILNWLNSVKADVSYDSVRVGDRNYWLDSKSDVNDLFQLWKESE